MQELITSAIKKKETRIIAKKIQAKNKKNKAKIIISIKKS